MIVDQNLFNKILAIQFALLCLVIPWSLAGMQIMIGIICLTFIIVSLINKTNYLKYHPLYILFSVFLLSLVLSALISSDTETGLQNIFHTNWIMLSLPIIASLPLSADDRNRALKILVFSAATVGIYGIFQFFTGLELLSGRQLAVLGNNYRATGTYTFYLTFAGNQLMIFGVAFVLFMQQKKLSNEKWLFLVAVILIGLSIIASFGRSAWIGTVVIILLGTFLFYRQYFWKIIISLSVVALVVLVALPDIRERFLIIFDTGHKYNSGRINLWQTSWLMIKEYPWFGVGPGLFETYFQQFKVPGLYDATSHAHNDYLHMAVQGGSITLFSWLAIWISFYYYSFKSLKKMSSVKQISITINATILALAGILTAALFQCYFVDLENSILWWVLVATAMQVLIQKNHETA